ncbi:metal-dependent transcriptional regulator [Nonlabens antarcticus]|uniref:metal-dependent transcriptional regulator n=1 Tax=Nonlabens antarcticus TaxID=392714 RepID=UPI001891BC1B|nr:metal-dependent transcriptional regulator [Nonlabens antarcticus]
MFTTSEENYLKAIYNLQQEEDSGVSTSSLAEILNTKAASVTEMVKKLADKKLVHYKKYYGAELTNTGMKQALTVVRKHRLWETFLVQHLGFQWDEVHEVAEQLEHIKSEQLIEAIDKLLGYPTQDPHGDPIPDKNGNLKHKNQQLLSDMEIGSTGIIVGVKDSSPTFLQYLDKEKITLGTAYKLYSKEEFDHALELEINGKPLRVSHKIASNLFVEEKS